MALNIENLNEVIALLEECHFNKASYYKLGLHLKLSDNTLKSIEHKHREQVDPCLRECLASWLRKADGVQVDPTIDTLRDALKGIDNAAADCIKDKQTVPSKSSDEDRPLTPSLAQPPLPASHKTLVTYDSTCYPGLTNEKHATKIFKLHDEQLKFLNRPLDIAILLYEEKKIIEKKELDLIRKKELSCERRLEMLLGYIGAAISEDHNLLLMFARICVNTGNQVLGHNIIKNCNAAFKELDAGSNEMHEVFGSIKDVKEKILNDPKALSKMTSILRQQLCIALSSAKDCMEAVDRKTTLFDTSLLEEIAEEIGCNTTKLIESSECMNSKMICNLPSREISTCITVETLTIAMACDSPVAEVKFILEQLFGYYFRDVVKWHSIKDDTVIVCYFPPVYATLLINKVIQGFSFCKEKQIKMITVGYLLVYDEFLYDKAYQELKERVDALEKRNLELEKMNQDLRGINEELIRKIDDLEKDMHMKNDFKEKAVQLEKELKEEKEHIKKLQTIESNLREELRTKDRIQKAAILQSEHLTSMLNKTKDLEKNTKKKQSEIAILQDKISSLSCEVIDLKEENKALKEEKTAIIAQFKLGKETGENIERSTNNPVSKETTIKEETTDQPTPMLQQQEYDPLTENISVSNSEITLTGPSLKTCKEIQIQQAVLSLHDAFVDSTSAILFQLPESITHLHINRTTLTHDSVHSIIQLLQRLKALRLTDVALPPTSLSYILNVLLTNESLEEFTIQFNSQMILPLSSTSAASYAQAISDVVQRNSTLQRFSALGLRLDEAGVVKILLALVKDNSTLRLLTLDQSHQATAYRFAEAHGPIKDRLSFFN
ncbi:PREDICTED: uncharacterized protein LOC109585544 [Amphimedon queenslandica]|uniref:Death domain-containing protein n=1 Tax=Amphimedon queenslandica TaxID=400682 RepID=A0A1X7TX41_AMPQE|nr:PREDICTED: uncharacterized protein LOC109585544 [Amphimedon queenslandica]|eukprot:XP_019857226.1 PREDICTED: uncharacterized protein LOC109585544 [Amphimedon queenslandica]